jgi:hypothetical protein
LENLAEVEAREIEAEMRGTELYARERGVWLRESA